MRASSFILSVEGMTRTVVERAPEVQPTGLNIGKIEFVLFICFIWSLSYEPQPAQRNELKRIRKIGSLSAACLLPLLQWVAIVIDNGGFDVGTLFWAGGQLFWPIFAGLSGMLGFTAATLYFILRRAKPKT